MSLHPNKSPNLAPVQPLWAARKNPEFQRRRLLDVLTGIRAELRREGESQEWVNRRLFSQRNELYFRGFQKLRRADLSNTWRVIDPKPVHFTLNEFQFWVNVNAAKWNVAKVDYNISGIPEDSEDAEQQAQKLRAIARYYDDRLWTRTLTIKASKAAQFTAYLVAYTYFNPQAGVCAYRPVVERLAHKLGPDAFRCADCNNAGEMPDGWEGQAAAGYAALCPQCGSSRLDVVKVPTVEKNVQTGEEAYDAGDVETRLLSIYNITWDAGLGLENSSAVLWEEDHDMSDLEAAYPGLKLPADKAESVGLSVKRNLQHAGREESRKRGTLSRMWVEPRRYHDVELEEAIETVSGVTIPAGTKPIDIFPNGFHAIMQGDLILDLYAAVKNEDLSVFEYHSMPDGGLAQGVDAMCEPQRMSNTGYSLWNLWLRHGAAPPKRYNPELIDPGDMSGDPTRPIPINSANLIPGSGATIENAIVTDNPLPFPAQAFEGLNRMRAFIQFAAGATEFSEGLPNVSNDTLGGARIGQSLSQSISGTQLAQFADFRAEIVKKTLRKVKQYCWDKRYLQLAGKYSTIEKVELENKDIPDDFTITPIPNSWLPRTAEQRQANFQALLLAVGGVIGLATTPPDVLAELCEVYDVRLDANLLPIAIRTARMRIKQMADFLPSVQQAQAIQAQVGMPLMQQDVDPMTGAPVIAPLTPGQMLVQCLQPQFNPREKGCAEAAEYLSAWFVTDEGLQSPPELIEAVGALQDLYIEAARMQAMVKAGVLPGDPMGAPPPQEGAAPGGPNVSVNVNKPAAPTPQPGAISGG
jgi:hypothetical protein